MLFWVLSIFFPQAFPPQDHQCLLHGNLTTIPEGLKGLKFMNLWTQLKTNPFWSSQSHGGPRLGVSQNVFIREVRWLLKGWFSKKTHSRTCRTRKSNKCFWWYLICLELQTTSFLWLFQLDDEPNHCYKKGLFHHFHPLKSGCLGYQVFLVFFLLALK